MIRIEGLKKKYGKREVLKGLSLTMNQGELTGIAGPNACGKTTLLKCILGLVVPNEGRIVLAGEEVSRTSEFRKYIGYMPQSANFPPNLSIQELFDMLEGVRGVRATKREKLIEYFELVPRLRQPLAQLSGGTRQKVAAIAALMFDAPLMILDEPTAGLDPLSSVKLKDLIRETLDEGKTVLLVSHLLAEIEELAASLVFLDEGNVAFAGPSAQIKARTGELTLERAVTRLFSGHERKERQPCSIVHSF